jgi:hypothetical protein
MFRLPEFINDVVVQVFLSGLREKHENRVGTKKVGR